MEVVNAVCACKNMNERNLVLAISDGSFDFAKRWGLLTWLAFLVLSFVTGGIWLIAVGLWHVNDIAWPKYRCQFCRREIPKSQVRAT